MSTVPTPLLQDKTHSSLTVTQLFHGGNTYIRDGNYGNVVADEAKFDSLTVTTLVVNGTVASSTSDTDLGLSPLQLVATNASATPVSFPYGPDAGQIAIRDADGIIAFTSWTAPANANQLFLATGSGTGIQFKFNAVVDSTITVPDVGADANVVVYGTNGLKNVIASGDNILHLKSPNSGAVVTLSGPNVAGSLVSYEFGTGDVAKAKIVSETDLATRHLTIRDALDNIRFRIVPNGITSEILFVGNLLPMTDGAWGLSNGNLFGYKSLFLQGLTATVADFTTTITLDSQGHSVLTLNNGEADSITALANKNLTFNNSFITPTSRILVSVMGLNGVVNAATVGVPYVAVTSVAAGTCNVRTYNISSAQTLAKRVTVAFLLLP